MKTRLIFVRHAEAEGNHKRVFHGWTDSELTEKGHRQAAKVAERLKGMQIDALYSSSLKRALQTAKYISETKGLPIIRTDKMKEINGGAWEGQRWDILPAKWPEAYETWEYKPHLHKMPEGESMEDFQRRLAEEVKSIINMNKGKTICIVTHGTAIRALQCLFHGFGLIEMLNIPWQDNTSITVVDFKNGTFEVIVEGDTAHLDKELRTIENQEWWEEYQKRFEDMRGKMKKAGGAERKKFMEKLFETGAIRVCPENKPFWYTSGTIGPYYINTHFLFGGEDKAGKLLELIDREKGNMAACPVKVLEAVRENYEGDLIFKEVIDDMCAFIKKNIDLREISFISGGERRDWFFSMMAAEILDKPHLSIYKNLTAVLAYKGEVRYAVGLEGKNVLHIADLVTEASSFERAWIPSIKRINGAMKWAVAVVDRKQGAEELLSKHGVKLFSLMDIDEGMFRKAYATGLINRNQYDMIKSYIENPRESMRNFLREHPQFLQDSIASDGKDAVRARLCIEKDIYGL